MKPIIVRHSINLDGHQTSISLEDEFWRSLQNIAASRGSSVRALVGEVNSKRQRGNLSSALRLFVLNYYQQQLSRLEPVRTRLTSSK